MTERYRLGLRGVRISREHEISTDLCMKENKISNRSKGIILRYTGQCIIMTYNNGGVTQVNV